MRIIRLTLYNKDPIHIIVENILVFVPYRNPKIELLSQDSCHAGTRIIMKNGKSFYVEENIFLVDWKIKYEQ